MLYNYKCEKHGIFEKNSGIADRKNPKICPKCFELAEYVVSAPRIKLEGWSGTFPSASYKWERYHEVEGRKIPD